MTLVTPREPSDTMLRRPSTLHPAELGFTPQKPVAWLSPTQLAATGIRVAFAAQFGAYLDKRELQLALPTAVHADYAQAEELWLDYISDLGDGFDATYSMAYLLAQDSLEVNDGVLPRARVLVMGGDQVYPTASSAAYEDRFEGPYKAAFPQPITESSPQIYALPGNHDWYDGLTAFLRLFARRNGNHIGGWQTKQTRSYFALQLPHGWWLLAIDAQGEAYLDDPQLEFFRGVAATFEKGDRIIIAVPQPSWMQTDANPRVYDTLDYFLRSVIDPSGAEVALMISGDLHHYARYASADAPRQLINCGGGGAYTAATHHLQEEIVVPPKYSTLRRSSQQLRYQLKKTYPSKMRSQWLGSGVFGRLPWRNPGFTAMLGIVHAMLLLALQNEAGRIVTVPIFLMVTVMLAAGVFFAVGLTEGERRYLPWVLGGLHGVAHLVLGIGGWLIWKQLPMRSLTWPLPVLSAVAIYLPLAGIAAALLTSTYLLVASRFRVNLNELFAGQGIEDFKSFLRLRFAPDGTLTVYPIGIDKISKRWVAQSTGSWFRPDKPMRPRLVDDPVVFSAPVRAPAEDAAVHTPSGLSTPTP
ncbi:MAG TPA: metallophosphoesterase [Candidatus Limnocylindrales bacterium]